MFLLALLATSLPASPAQNAQKVLEDYLRAMGGAKALAQIQTATIAGSLTEESTGQTGSYSLIAKAPNRLCLEIIAGSGREVEAYNGMSAWGQDTAEGLRTLTGAPAKEAEASARYWNSRLADVKKAKFNLRLVGLEKVRGRDAYHVQVTMGPGLTREVFFDAQSHLIVKEAEPASALEIEYDDYQPSDGIPTPHRIEIRRGGHQYKVAVTRAEFNRPVEDTAFDIPHPAGALLPDIKGLIMEVTKNQKAIDELQKQYTCHVTEEEQKVDSKGRIASSTAKEYEVFNIAGDEVRHLIAKDGKPLAGDEKKKEDERFNKEYDKMEKKAGAPVDAKKQAQEDAKDQAQISDFLRAVRFLNLRRERFRGHDVIAVDFGPNPEYKPKKMIEGIIQKLMGVVWIDEQALDVVRLEGHFADTAKIGGGVLAAIDKGSSFVFEQAKMNDEVWLPVYAEFHVAGRFLVIKARANEIDRYSDYKKFKTDSRILSIKN
ncbi:MAG TPA: hypothetical protein VLY04_20670 [Bryobacteraceae bacterium]|nr:hypothetical protein [Bryobacteraceae bacterium]